MATYDDILALYSKLKIHQRHLQFLAIEIYMCRNKFIKIQRKRFVEQLISEFTNKIPSSIFC